MPWCVDRVGGTIGRELGTFIKFVYLYLLRHVLLTTSVICSAQIVTADHGNCEVMVDPDTGEPHTAHTTNLVPVALVCSFCTLFNKPA